MKDIRNVLIDYIFDDVEKRNELIEFYEEYFGIELSIPLLIKNLDAMDNRTLLEIIEDGYTDTCVRSDIFNFHSEMLIDMPWPINGDTEELKEIFKNKLDSAYVEQGYKVL